MIGGRWQRRENERDTAKWRGWKKTQEKLKNKDGTVMIKQNTYTDTKTHKKR